MAIVIAGVLLLMGCGGSVAGDEPAAPAAVRWDPCSIPTAELHETGLDPTYSSPGFGDGVVVTDWSLCTLRGPATNPSYFFNITSSELHTLTEARSNGNHVGGADMRINGRDAFMFKTEISESVTDCNIAVTVSPGVVVFAVDSMGTDEIGSDPCDLVLDHATDLELLLSPA